ncbi:MAG: RNA-binding protein [Bacteroidetes bacterium]|nr:RNA-binding protein [Fibrella sp.]
MELSLHQQLDAAVAEAYGWPDGLPESETLTRLVRLNHERAAEEQAGHIRYLRPAYQRSGGPAPESVQMGLNLTTADANGPVGTQAPELVHDVQREWPKDLAKQMQAVRDMVQQAGGPVSPVQVAARFVKLRPVTVQPLLATLSALALLRQTHEGYVG